MAKGGSRPKAMSKSTSRGGPKGMGAGPKGAISKPGGSMPRPGQSK